MVDYIKILVKDLNPEILEVNPLLDFYDRINLSTGEIKTTNHKGQIVTPCKNAFYKGLEFRIYETGTIFILGSLHKYWNSGGHNYNDFSYCSFVEVLIDLKRKFGIEPKNSILKCVEIGVNITPPKPTNEILDYCFLHKTQPFEYQKNSEEGKYKQVEHSQYIIKLYNKALHYKSKFNIDGEILRFEIKYKKMEKLNKRGVRNLQDLQDYGLHNFKNELLNEFKNVLYFDNTICSESIRIANYSNPLYWLGLINNKSKSNFYKHKEILKQLTENSNKIQSQIIKIMSNKIDFLNNKGASIDPLTIMSKPTPLSSHLNDVKRLCQITGLNISMQKDNSILLSYSGLRFYYKNDRKIFEQIKRRYLSKKWFVSDFETQIKEIAHNIRNTKSNQKIKQTRVYQPQQINLLSVFQL